MIIKYCAASIIFAVCVVFVKQQNQWGAVMTGICACVIFMTALFDPLRELFDFLEAAAAGSGLSDSYLRPVLKITGTAIAVRFAGDVCRDAGQNAVAFEIELLGTAAGMVFCIPLIKEVLKLIEVI